MVESTAKLREEILALSGVDIMEDANTFKSTYKIMDELAAKWENLTDIQQASITELIAGKRQGNIVSSLMSNFDTARQALDTSMNSAGSAMAEHEKWMQSVEASVNKVKAAWQSLSQSFLKSDFLTGLLNGVSSLADGLSKLMDTFGTLPTLATLFMGGMSLFNKGGFFKVARDELTGFATGITTTFGQVAKSVNASLSSINLKTGFRAGLLESEITSLRSYSNALNHNVSQTTAWNNCMANASEAAQEVARSNEFLTGGLEGYIKTQQSAEVATLAQNKSLGSARVLMNEYQSGCKTTGMAQTDFANAVKQTNPALATAMTSTSSASSGMVKYTASLIGAKVASFGLQIAVTALNMALTMGIGLLVSGLFSAISKVINRKKELAEKVDEITSKFKEQHAELQKVKGDFDTTNVDSMISKYERLAKGVDEFGNNLSLTASEYAEYQDIVNSIADQVPSLIQGYDAQGNAILNYKGNVEELTAAYEELIKRQNDSVLKGDAYEDIEEDFKNAMEDANDKGAFKRKTSLDDIHGLEVLLNSKNLDSVIHNMSSYGTSINSIIGLIEDEGIDKFEAGDNSFEFVKENLTKNRDAIQRVVNDFNANLDAEAEGMRSAAQAALSNAFDFSDSKYKNIGDKTQSLIRQIVGNFDAEHFNTIINKGQTVEEYINDMLDSFRNMSKGEVAQLEAAFDLQTKFNGGDISYGEYVQGIENAEKLIDGLDIDSVVKNQIKLTLDTEEIQDEYDALKERLTSDEYNIKMKTEEAEEFLDGLTSSEYQVAVDLIDDEDVDFNDFNSIKELKKYIEEQAKINEAMAFTTDIEVDTTALETLNTVLTESASAMGLTEESIDSLKAKYSNLESFDAATLFEATANGVKVNREELAKLEKEYNDLTKSEVKEHIDSLAEAYNDVTAEIDKCKNAGERAQLLSKREGYKTQIEELAEYQAQLEGVTGAYQRWLDAQNTPEDYEGYQAVATSREDIKDEIDRGFISNASKEYIDLLSGKDLTGGNIDDYANAWEKLDDKVTGAGHSINDFFTVNDDGDITATGIDRFFESVQTDFKGSVAKFNEETGKWTYDFSQENLQKIQDEWGIGIEAIGLLLEAAASAGYEVDWDGILDGIDLDTSNFETLVSYAEKAQKAFNELEGVEDVDFNFTATGVEEATSELEKARSTYIDLITNDDGTINLKAEGAEQMRVILSTLLVQKQQLEDANIAINIDTSGLDKSQQDIANAIEAIKTFREKYKNLEIAVTTGQGIDTAKSELSKAMGELQTLGGEGVDIAAQLILGEGTDGATLKTKVDAAIAAVGDKNVKVGCNLDETAIGDLNSQILTNFTPEATVKITGIDDSLVGQYTSTEKTANGTVKWKNDDSLVVEYQEKTKKAVGIVDWSNNTNNVKKSFSATGTVTWTSGNNVKVNVISNAAGTANANGSTGGRAFARGNWGIKGNGVALGGELGQELVVRDGKFFTIGDKGAEFFQYKHNDIVFNAAQTESLFKYGGIKGAKPRGTMLATGTAFAGGSYPSSGSAFPWSATASESNFAANRKEETITTTTTTTTTKKSSSSSSSSKSSSSSSSSKKSSSPSSSSTKDEKEFEETIDWIETAIDRIERAIDKLDKKANNVYKNWSERNKALSSEIGKVREEIELQEDAAERYLQEANSVGLDSSYAEKVRNGTIDIQDFKGESNEELVEKIKKYQEWYEKYLDCIDAAEELREQESKLYAQRFENIQSQYDGILQGYEHTESMLNEYISQAEAQGHLISRKYYDALINNEKQNISELKKEQSALIAERDKAVDDGEIEKYSQAWYEQCAAIDEVTQSIEEANTALLEYNNSIRELDWEKFDLIQERISDITAESEFLIELMSNDKLFDDKGKLTGQGAATMGLHALNYNTAMYQSDDYGKEIAQLDKQIAKDPYDQELINRRRELVELQREQILAAEDEKNAIRDLVEEGINLELDALQELIDKKNESLEAEKD